jgi:hypothetical protein
MIQAARPVFVAHGLPEDYCFSDALAPQSAPTAP